MELLHLAKLEKARTDYPQAPRWRDPDDKGTLYRRITGGLAWPRGRAPGALVVLAEQADCLPAQDARLVRVVAEFTDGDPEQLLRRASHWAETLCCRAWMTPLRAPEMRLAQDYNDARRLMMFRAYTRNDSSSDDQAKGAAHLQRFFTVLGEEGKAQIIFSPNNPQRAGAGQ